MSLIFSNKPLNLTNIGESWAVAIPFENEALAVYNEQARATTLDLGRGSTDAPTAAQKFGAQLSWKSGQSAAIVLHPDDVLDLRTLGIFICKSGDFSVISGTHLKKTRALGEFSQSTKYGQIGIFETGAIIELNCSQGMPDHAPEFWQLDPALGWQQINIWDVPSMLEPI